ncbi:hypothetical protein [Amycolatopsis granulosa]|uniref:hypothetical protein n=1 Tax=Amycolatopsis granulosa TaxID=185684 RepID=UPI00142277D7|nr:hypothetical protein [Amycolatopsis granulosa]NIH83768.1 hypothetical protein [Amycolatopsis granulosa]
MSGEMLLIIFRDNPGEFAGLVPPFAKETLRATVFDSITLQWPKAANPDEKRRVMQFIMTAAAPNCTHQTLTAGKRGRSVVKEGSADFVGAVDDLDWWLGDVVLLFFSADQLKMAWMPGSDGSFLHIAASRDMLAFRVQPAIQEIGFALGWVVESQ